MFKWQNAVFLLLAIILFLTVKYIYRLPYLLLLRKVGVLL